ncbi:transmembrane protein 242-like [Haliotis rubra]|uniref:transmembrane protein 242-like n=1 Tax=Haliotis rubra TaxID=36100 RepID=UPI001EE594F6|nr:transmembrane protein 242-like [Haliotis rubra]
MASTKNKIDSGERSSAPKDTTKTDSVPPTGTPKLIGGVFLATVAGLSILGGFGMTVAMAKKKDPNMFNKGMIATRELPESGSSLAARALAWGSFYSMMGVGLFSFTVWKLMGVHNMKEFTAKMQSIMPKIPKKESQGRTEFSSIRELFEYLIDEDKKSDKKS